MGRTGAPLHVAIASMDAARNVPTMVWAGRDQARARPAHDTPEAAARRNLDQYASLYRLSQADLQAAYVHSRADPSHRLKNCALPSFVDDPRYPPATIKFPSPAGCALP